MRPLAAPSLLALAASFTAAAAAPVTFTSDGSNFQSFIAPEAGTYTILAFGAQGATVPKSGLIRGTAGLAPRSAAISS